jgi:hypothetical protein
VIGEHDKTKEINQVVCKIKTIIMTLGVVMAFSALSAASASAEWLVGGTVLTGSAALSAKALVDVASTLLLPALGLAVVCGGHFLDMTDPLMIAPDRVFASSLTFLGCNVTAPASGCALEEKEQPIPLNPILARAFLGVGEEDRLLFAPETKGIFANIKFSEINSCAFNGQEPVKGSFIAGLPTGRLNLVTQALVSLGSVENHSLEVGGQPAFIEGGRALMRLASESTWSFM